MSLILAFFFFVSSHHLLYPAPANAGVLHLVPTPLFVALAAGSATPRSFASF